MTFERHVEGVARLAGDRSGVSGQWYEAPAFYFTNPYAVRGPHDDVPGPPGCQLFDLELEVAAVIGRVGRDVPPDKGASHIAGYTIANDFGLHDFRDTDAGSMLRVKGADTFAPLGPGLVTDWDFHSKSLRT